MARGKSGKKSKNKGRPGNHANLDKKMWKRSAKNNAIFANVAPAYVPVPAPLPAPVPAHFPPPVPGYFPVPVPGHFPAHVPTPLPAHVPTPLPAHVPAQVPAASSDISNDEAGTGEGVAGFIFMCSGMTKPECYRYRVFGLPKGKMEAVEKIKAGAKLFLFDFDLKLLYGIYKAMGNGGEHLEPAAFGGSFPAQVRFSIEKDCLPVPESVFKHAIRENYRGKKFMPDLNSEQVEKISSLFQLIPMQQIAHMPPFIARRYPAVAQLPPPPVPYRTAGPPLLDNHHILPAQFHPHEPYTPSAAPVDDRRLPPPQHDPYRVAAYATRAPRVMEPCRNALPVGLPPADHYGSAAHPAHVLPVSETRNTLPMTDQYYPPDPRRAYPPQNPPEHELVGRYLGGREARMTPQADPQIDYYNMERAAPPASGPMSDYYSTQHAHTDPMVSYYPQSSAPQQVDPTAAYYSTQHAAPTVAVEMQPHRTHVGGLGYQDPNHMYAGNLARSVPGAASAPHAPVSSMYPPPAYR